MSTNQITKDVISEARKQIDNLECTVDWLTATTEDVAIGFSWYDLLKRHQAALCACEGRYIKLKESKIMMYRGVEFEGLFWGQSEKQGFIMVAKSETAEGLWREIVPGVRRISRVDLSVTAHLAAPRPGVANSHYLSRSVDGRRKYAVVLNSNGGQTLYVGSRQSEFYGRVYDKSAEQGDAAGWSWRYEVECKSPSNTAMMSSLLESWQGGSPVSEDIGTYVHKWFKVRGVTPIFTPRLLAGSALETDTVLKVRSPHRSLMWLRTQVAPTIARLVDAGYLDEVIPALGLERYSQMTLAGDEAGANELEPMEALEIDYYAN